MTIKRKISAILESQDDLHYYVSEGCGAFAYALWIAYGKPRDATIGVISNDQGEAWGDVEFEATHAFLDGPGGPVDVYGPRSVEDMAHGFYLASWSLQGPYHPDVFLEHLCGEGDDKPLYCNAEMIDGALQVIMQNKHRYGLTP